VEALQVNLEALLMALPYFVILLGALVAGKVFYNRTTPYHFDQELVERDNGAFGVLLGLYLLGLMIAIGGTLYWGIGVDWRLLLLVVGSCVLCILLMRLSVVINDWLLLPRFSIDKEIIQDRNVGTAFVVGGGCVATGLIINGSLSVQIPGQDVFTQVQQALLSTLLFFVVGQMLLIVGALVFVQLTAYDVHDTIEKDDNLAAGLSFGGFLVGLGIIVRSAIFHASSDYFIEVLTALVYAALGMVLLLATRVFVDKVLLPSSPLSKEVAQDKNPAAGTLAATCFVCIALAFAWVVDQAFLQGVPASG
jgi:uncharacterized membrane protein YjfL (UPF0719 family)